MQTLVVVGGFAGHGHGLHAAAQAAQRAQVLHAQGHVRRQLAAARQCPRLRMRVPALQVGPDARGLLRALRARQGRSGAQGPHPPPRRRGASPPQGPPAAQRRRRQSPARRAPQRAPAAPAPGPRPRAAPPARASTCPGPPAPPRCTKGPDIAQTHEIRARKRPRALQVMRMPAVQGIVFTDHAANLSKIGASFVLCFAFCRAGRRVCASFAFSNPRQNAL